MCIVFTFAYARIKDNEALSDLPDGSQLVDIGGRKIHFHVMGLENSGPAIVLIPGQPGNATPDSGWWIAVQNELAKTMRVYAYDEPGYTWSDPGPDKFSNVQSADALSNALATLGEDEVILASFANGNLTALDLYHRHPGEPQILGMLWIDPDELTASRISRLKKRYDELHVYNTVPFLRFLTEIGIGRLGLYGEWIAKEDDGLLDDLLPTGIRETFDWNYYNKVKATRGCRNALNATFERASTYVNDLEYTASLPVPKDIPIFILQTDLVRELKTLPQEAKDLIPEQTKWYRMIAENAPGGRYIHVPESSHLIMIERPWDVAEAIGELMSIVKGR
jgi:pimeloyl-ACP methyl ester carboxylesterase